LQIAAVDLVDRPLNFTKQLVTSGQIGRVDLDAQLGQLRDGALRGVDRNTVTVEGLALAWIVKEHYVVTDVESLEVVDLGRAPQPRTAGPFVVPCGWKQATMQSTLVAASMRPITKNSVS